MTDEVEPTESVTPMPIAVFEGAFITEMEAVLPRLVMAMPEGYKRGTHLDLKVEVRVQSVRMDELRSGDMKRVHVLAIEDVQVQRVFDPDAESQVLSTDITDEDKAELATLHDVDF